MIQGWHFAYGVIRRATNESVAASIKRSGDPALPRREPESCRDERPCGSWRIRIHARANVSMDRLFVRTPGKKPGHIAKVAGIPKTVNFTSEWLALVDNGDLNALGVGLDVIFRAVSCA